MNLADDGKFAVHMFQGRVRPLASGRLFFAGLRFLRRALEFEIPLSGPDRLPHHSQISDKTKSVLRASKHAEPGTLPAG